MGCRKRFEQAKLVRFVRYGGGWAPDTGRVRAPGRGAYVCSKHCGERALKNKRFAALGQVALDLEWDGV